MFESLLPVVALAEGTGIVGVFQNLASDVLSLARGIVLPIAIIGIIICGIKIMIATDPQSVAATKKWLMYIVIGIIIVMFAPAILDQLKGLADNGAFNWATGS